jgi:hypothetical protein
MTDATAKQVVEDMTALILAVPAAQRVDYIEQSVCLLIAAMRGAAGDEYVRGFLDAARADIDQPAARYEMARH